MRVIYLREWTEAERGSILRQKGLLPKAGELNVGTAAGTGAAEN